MNNNSEMPLPEKVLGLGGLIPFIACTLGLWVLPQHYSLVVIALLGYAAVILSFLGGVRWGTHIVSKSRSHDWLAMALSMVPSLLAWPALLINPQIALIVLLTGFLLQYWLDVQAATRGELPTWFARLRGWLTTVVAICLLVSQLKLVLG